MLIIGRVPHIRLPHIITITRTLIWRVRKWNYKLPVVNMRVKWTGKGIAEKAYDQNGKCIIRVDKRYFRPAEVESLLGSSKKASKFLKWKPKYSILSLVKEMVSSELKQLKK